jgi:protein disulfide-isomerase
VKKPLAVTAAAAVLVGLGALLLATPKAKPARSATPGPAEGEGPWLTDYKKAQQQAKSSQKLLLLQFTGSDWCPPCRMMQNEIFSTKEFRDYATKNFVLMEIDFPRRKAQPPEIAEQNQLLAQRYQITVFPTVIVSDADGKKIGELAGYDPSAGLPGFIADLEKIRKS